MESRIPFTHMDKQRRLWNATWQERCYLTDQGGFCHAARKIHLQSPRCCRALQVAAHFRRLADGTDVPIVAALRIEEQHSALPIVTAMEITSESADLITAKTEVNQFDPLNVIKTEQITLDASRRVLGEPLGSEVAHPTNGFFNVVDGVFDFGVLPAVG